MNSSKFLRALVTVVIIVGAALLYVRYIRVPSNVAYVTSEDGGISVIDLNSLQVIKQIHPAEVSPRGLGVTSDGKYLVTANKDSSDVTIFDTRRLRLVRRVPVGDNPEFIKLDPDGKSLFATFEPSSSGGPPKEDANGQEEVDENEPPSQVVQLNVQDWSRTRNFIAGKETEGIEFSADGKLLIVANEAQNTLGVHDLVTGKHLQDVNLASVGIRPRGVKRSPLGNGYAVTMESSGTLLTLDNNFNVARSVPTGAKPYGVSYDRAGKRIFVAAATARKLQVFTADSLELIKEVPVGQRCWHFTFTPDDSKILMACGRSNNIYVIDANSYTVIKTIDGFQLPWGIAAYPPSFGSLGLP